VSAAGRPLSFAQQQLWLLDRIRPGSPAYNVTTAFHLEGALDEAALGRALDATVARHQALRTTFHEAGEEPAQVVGPPRPVELERVDLGALPADQREAALARCLGESARRPFDLSRDLMLRAALVRLGEREHVVLLVLHHIASDGWSLGVLARELEAHYAAARRGGVADLPPLPTQYGDHAAWQRTRLTGPRLAAEIAFWRERLAGAPPALVLPADRPRPTVIGDGGAHCVRLVPSRLVSAVKALARTERATLFAALLAAFQSLLHRYTGETDLVIGTASACRTRREIEPLIGYFVNTLPLRMDLRGDPTFRELLRQARQVASEALGHQELPFERLVAALAPERRLDRSPLLQVTLVLHDGRNSSLPRLADLAAAPVRVSTGTAKFDLSLVATETAGGIQLLAEYSTDLFDAATVVRLLEHFAQLLEGAVTDPDRRISALPLLSEEDSARIAAWSGAPSAKASEECLHHLVAARTAEKPEAVAIVSAEGALTYRELEARADVLARYL
jgi:Condensation domain